MQRTARATSPARRERTAESYVPAVTSLKRLRESAALCHGCDLYRCATQTVFGEGSATASLMLVGEVPGDVEDLEGRPFVGPAGKLLRRVLAEVGIDERDVYLTNAVKHFKFIERGKRRIHATPKRIEVRACSPWLEAELRLVRPVLVVALGATAAQALLGAGFRLTQHRGEVLSSPLARHVVATIHPSAVLRSPDSAGRRENLETLSADLRFAAAEARRLGRRANDDRRSRRLAG